MTFLSKLYTVHFHALSFVALLHTSGCTGSEEPADTTPSETAADTDTEPVDGEPALVVCENLGTCEADQICVIPGQTCECNTETDQYNYVEQSARCDDVPAACAKLEGNDLAECLAEQLCAVANEETIFDGDTLACNDTPLDCFGDECANEGEPAPVVCGDTLCDLEEICVIPGDTCECNAETGQLEYVNQPRRCAARPDNCTDLVGQEEMTCLEEQLCELAGESTQLDEGQLTCDDTPQDCGGPC